MGKRQPERGKQETSEIITYRSVLQFLPIISSKLQCGHAFLDNRAEVFHSAVDVGGHIGE